AGEHGQPDDVGVLLQRGLHDLLGRLVQAGVDDLHTRVAQSPGHHLDTAVVAVQPGLGHHYPNALSHARNLLVIAVVGLDELRAPEPPGAPDCAVCTAIVAAASNRSRHSTLAQAPSARPVAGSGRGPNGTLASRKTIR